MKKLFTYLFLFVSSFCFSQTLTYSVQPDGTSGVDAIVDAGNTSTNYATNTSFKDERYQNTNWYNKRGYIYFDLSSIPANANLISASLYLTGVNHVGSNASYLRKVTASWTETGITYSNQPANTTTGQLSLAQSTSATQTYTVDVKTHVQDFIDNPINNYGWVMLLQDEASSTARTLDFASSDHATAASRPKLVVQYTLPVNILGSVVHATEGADNNGAIVLTTSAGVSPYTYSWSNSATTKDIYNLAPGVYTVTVTDAQSFQTKKYFIVGRHNSAVTVSIQPDSYTGKDAEVLNFDSPTSTTYTNYESLTTLYCMRWTSGSWFTTRGFIEFDLSSIPSNATVSTSTLTLYGTDHNPLQRANSSYLRRVNAAWNEYDVTWANQPANTTTGQISLAASTSSTQNYSLDVATHVQDMITNPTGNFGWVLRLQDETTSSYTKLVFGSSDHATSTTRPKLDITFTVPAATDNQHNWTLNETYDESGTVIASLKEYTDELGRQSQTLAENSTGTIFASQMVYDSYGRPAVTTLAAPVGNTLTFQENFFLNGAGTDYNYNNFDNSSKLNDPDSVLRGISNTLGTYYSDNGNENYIATSKYPFNRVEFSSDPTSVVTRASGAGEAFKMGSGHESRFFQMVAGDELRTLFGTNLSYKSTISPTDKMSNSAINIGADIVATKTVKFTGDGKVIVTYAAGGKSIASCMSGLGSPEACTMSTNTIYMLYNGTQSVDIHLPAANLTSLKLPLPTYTGDEGTVTVGASNITYKITDLTTNNVLTAGDGNDYTINSSTRFVTFNSGYATGSHIYRISFTYTSSFISSMISSGFTIPDAKVQYDLDYGQWSVNYYDLAGQLRKTVSAKAISSCTANGATMFTTYDYSHLGQVVAIKSADEGLSEIVYDKEGRVRFTQDPIQQSAKKFSYIHYDAHGRGVESGEYSTLNNGATSAYFNNYYTAYSAPYTSNVSSTTILDNTDGLTDSQCADKSYTDYNPLASADEIPAAYTYKSTYSGKTKAGQISRTRNDNTTTWYAYDNNDRLVGTVKQILDADWTAQYTSANTQIKTMDFVYDAYTGLLEEQYYQKNDTAAKLEHWYTYNSDRQLTKIEIKRGAAPNKETIADYEYYSNRKLKRTSLGVNLQGLDYVYTLNGALKAVNHPCLDENKDPGLDGKSGSSHSGFAKDIFGFALEYYTNDYTRTGSNLNTNATTGGYNGLIYATRYKTRDITNSVENYADNVGGMSGTQLVTGTTEEFLDQYTYDKFNRLATAVFNVWNNSSNSLSVKTDYKEYGSSSGGIAYDANGNITNLQRNGYAYTSCANTMDNLAYTYTSGTNKLASILDNAGATSCFTTDFEAATSKSFTYNAKGQMTVSQAENVTDVSYHAGGKVKKVTFSTNNNSYTEYFYDDGGQRYKVKFTNNSTGKTFSTWYIYGTVCEQNTTINNNINLTELTVGNRIGVVKNTGAFLAAGEINYELTDHSGNVRVTFKKVSSGVAEVVTWNDYYVFGAVKPGRSYNPSQYRYQFQGQENNNVDGTNWDMFELRMFNNDLGRWSAPDPARQFASPYIGIGNNPINGTDRDGAWVNAGQRRDLNLENAMQRVRDNWKSFYQKEYFDKKRAFELYHGDGYGGVDPMYTDEYLRLDAEYAQFFDQPFGIDEVSVQTNGGALDNWDDNAGISSKFLRRQTEKYNEMMSGQTTVTVSFFGITLSESSFDDGADAAAFTTMTTENFNPVKSFKVEEEISKVGLITMDESVETTDEFRSSNVVGGEVISELSFEFTDITSNWQACGVKDLIFTASPLGQPEILLTSPYFEIEVGVPKELFNGDKISRSKAQEEAASAANKAALLVQEEIFVSSGNPVVLSSAPRIFASYMSIFLNEKIPGSRVNTPILTRSIVPMPALYRARTFWDFFDD